MYLKGTSDILRINVATPSDIEVAIAWADSLDGSPPAVSSFGREIFASITGAGNTTLLTGVSGHTLKPKDISVVNNHASQATVVYFDLTDGTDTVVIAGSRCTLLAGESLKMDENGVWIHYDKNNGIYASPISPVVFNNSVAAQGAGFSTDTYLTGSFLKFIGPPKVGTKYKCRFSVSKTAAGTATPIITVRVGTAGTTADTGRGTHTFSAGTAATDVAWFEVSCVFRTVGSGTSAVLQSHCALTSQPTTGFSSLLKGTQATSGGFDSTVADLGIGVSVNGGTSASWTVQMVVAEIENN